jgi:hypothetical protein
MYVTQLDAAQCCLDSQRSYGVAARESIKVGLIEVLRELDGLVA